MLHIFLSDKAKENVRNFFLLWAVIVALVGIMTAVVTATDGTIGFDKQLNWAIFITATVIAPFTGNFIFVRIAQRFLAGFSNEPGSSALSMGQLLWIFTGCLYLGMLIRSFVVLLPTMRNEVAMIVVPVAVGWMAIMAVIRLVTIDPRRMSY